jgi:sulfonate transport system substrate-binding protein
MVSVLIACSLGGCGGDRPEGQPGASSTIQPTPVTLTKISIGIQVSPAMSLVMVAKERNFFRNEGLDVELKQFTAGKFALQAFLAKGVDYAVAGEVPVCLATLQGNQLRVIAQVVERTTNEVRIVAKRDGNLKESKSWFKKSKRRLATSFGGGPEFFTYNFLKNYGIAKEQVEILSLKPEDMPAALESGSVDAISIFDPFAFIAETRLRGQVITLSNPDLYSELYVLVARPEQIERNSNTIEAMLRALVRAADFVRDNPATSKEILRGYTKLDPDVIEGIWSNFQFRPALTLRLLDYWKQESEWAQETGKIKPDVSAPDFRLLIEDRFLNAVAREAVEL